ncbi:cytochrome P450 [Streptomyces sp. SAI-041]|uniref:cytochrome P450 n=1 Tax=Streptomyces sp. SAI-041 TaxID=2940548 RepID=UPI002473D4A0|nr:cytochrome P450 [Streptomyces sp. SAI-041]MDH6554454.1 cytochrome P450 [Streptomyces sp. SAI-041]
MKKLSSIPAAPQALPLVGHLLPLLRNPTAFLDSLPAYGDMVKIRVGPFSMVVLCDPGLTHQVLLDDRTFDKGGPIYDRAREVSGNGIGTSHHDEHRRLRRLVQPSFHPSRLPGYAETMTACIDETASSWRSGQVLDVPAEMMAITSKIAIATLFSGALSQGELDKLLDASMTLLAGFYRRMFLVPPLDRLPLPSNRAYTRARNHLHEVCGQIIAQRRVDGTDHEDLVSALLAAHDVETDGRGMTDAEIIDTIVAILLAGIENTASALAWSLDFLAQHPQVERQLHAEVDTVLNGAAATYADLHHLEFTNRVITETLRLRPPAWFFTRTVTADTHLGGHFLPAGTNVAYSPYLIHHRHDLHNAPEDFDPDRWDPQRPQPHRHAMIPFASGARKCPGDTFAMAEATLALASITARWQLEHAPGIERRPALSLTLKHRALPMRTRPRTVVR